LIVINDNYQYISDAMTRVGVKVDLNKLLIELKSIW